MRILYIMKTFSILDDYTFFFFSAREQGILTFVTLPYPSAALQLSRLPLLFPKACKRHCQSGIYPQHRPITLSRACGFGDISRHCPDLLDTPFHTFFFVFHTFLGLRSFSFFGFFAHPSPAFSSRLTSGRKSKYIETKGP